jgi:hypothetical protein
MAKYALLEGNKIASVHVADSIEALGDFNLLFEVVEVTGLDPEPARGWERHEGAWVPPAVPEAAKALWNGTGFDDANAIEAPAEEEPKKGK